MKRLLLLLALLPVTAMAAGLEVTFNAPTKYIDDTAIDKALTFILWGAPEGQAAKEVSRASTTTITVASLPDGRWCGQVYAVVDNVYSDPAPSPPFCVTIGSAPPPTKKKPAPVSGVQTKVIP